MTPCLNMVLSFTKKQSTCNGRTYIYKDIIISKIGAIVPCCTLPSMLTCLNSMKNTNICNKSIVPSTGCNYSGFTCISNSYGNRRIAFKCQKIACEDKLRTCFFRYHPARRKQIFTWRKKHGFIHYCLSMFWLSSKYLFWCKYLFLLIILCSLLGLSSSLQSQCSNSCYNRERSNIHVVKEKSLNTKIDYAMSLSTNSISDFCQRLIHCLSKNFHNRTVHRRSTFDVTESSMTIAASTKDDIPYDMVSCFSYCETQMNFHKKFSLQFCTRYEIIDLFKEIPCTKTSCMAALEEIVTNDNQAKRNHDQFMRVLSHYATPDLYSSRWNNAGCLKNYKSWICTEHHTRYETNDTTSGRSRKYPCSKQCSRVEASCPIFRIFNRTKLRGGQPVFICKGFPVKAKQDMPDCYVYPDSDKGG